MESRTDASSPERTSDPEAEARDAWWSLLASIYKSRRLIIGVTALAAVASIVISLLLPKWYESTARVILPSEGSGGLDALIGNLNPAAAALIGGVGGDYIRYMSILTSNTMKDRVIAEFDLMDVYDTRDNKTPIRDTREMLEENTEFEIDLEYDYLTISALHKDPVLAAEMANFMVDELNRINIELSTESARAYRQFVERRYEQTVAGLDSALADLEEFQQEHGLIELEQQAEAFLEVLAQYRAAAFQAEIEYQGLVQDFGEDSPVVQSARNRVEAAREKVNDLLEGRDPLMPVAMSDLPEIGRGYTQAMRDVMIYEKILEFARPVLEQAIFEEQREAPAVQVLDRGSVPEWKAKPKRALIVIGATISAFILVILYVIGMHWLRQNREYFAQRIDAELTRS